MGDRQADSQDIALTENGGQPPPTVDRRLSIPDRRLAGSSACLNCGTVLQGPFCHYCGQPDRNLLRFFPVLMRELLEDFFDFDSRFMRTMKPLLFRPGKLTRDYLEGRRFRYVPPLRLYIFSSIAFFFVAATMAGDIVLNGADESPEADLTVEFGTSDSEQLEQALGRLDADSQQKVRQALEEAERSKAEADVTAEAEAEDTDGDEDRIDFQVGGKPWDRETNPVDLPLMPDWINDWLNDEIAQSPQKAKEIEANPDLIKDQVFEVLPATMFVLLPLFALLLKFWYLFARKYYVEHLIYALHNHSFIFVVILLVLGLNALGDWLDPGGEAMTSTVVAVASTAFLCWIPLYLLISLKRVYNQGWVMTVAKYSVVGVSYMVVLGFATAFVAVLSFLLL